MYFSVKQLYIRISSLLHVSGNLVIFGAVFLPFPRFCTAIYYTANYTNYANYHYKLIFFANSKKLRIFALAN